MSIHAPNFRRVAEEDSDSDFDPHQTDDLDDDVSEEDMEPVQDLFSKTVFKSTSALLKHMKESYEFDLAGLVGELDFYSTIKAINFARVFCERIGEDEGELGYSVKETVEGLVEKLSAPSETAEWNNDRYLVAALPGDPLLYVLADEGDGDDDDSLPELEMINDQPASPVSKPKMLSQPTSNIADAGQLAVTHVQNLATSHAQLLARVAQLEHQLQVLRSDEDDEDDVPALTSAAKSGNNTDPDGYYFESYSHLDIHEEMLKDRVRTIAYKESIELNSLCYRDKVVLDVGCGTGILSLFAARAGARKVFAIDQSEMAHGARAIIRKNGYQDTITVVKEKVEYVADLAAYDPSFRETSPDGKVDIIISEWMGYLLLFESMLDSVLHIRDRLLKPGGRVFPNIANIYLEGITDKEFTSEKLQFWRDVYGFDMTCLFDSTLPFDKQVQEPEVTIVDAAKICTNRAQLHSIDIETVQAHELDFEKSFTLKVEHQCDLSAIAISFDCLFTGNKEQIDQQLWRQDVNLSTSVSTTPTHWKQALLWLSSSFSAEAGDELTGTLSFARNTNNPREIDLKLDLKSQDPEKAYHVVQKYHMS